MVPVSYTHLDVYKRQLYSGITFATGAVEWVLGLTAVALAVAVGFLGNYLVNCAAFWLVEICLLYTSRCV